MIDVTVVSPSAQDTTFVVGPPARLLALFTGAATAGLSPIPASIAKQTRLTRFVSIVPSWMADHDQISVITPTT